MQVVEAVRGFLRSPSKKTEDNFKKEFGDATTETRGTVRKVPMVRPTVPQKPLTLADAEAGDGVQNRHHACRILTALLASGAILLGGTAVVMLGGFVNVDHRAIIGLAAIGGSAVCGLGAAALGDRAFPSVRQHIGETVQGLRDLVLRKEPNIFK